MDCTIITEDLGVEATKKKLDEMKIKRRKATKSDTVSAAILVTGQHHQMSAPGCCYKGSSSPSGTAGKVRIRTGRVVQWRAPAKRHQLLQHFQCTYCCRSVSMLVARREYRRYKEAKRKEDARLKSSVITKSVLQWSHQ